MDPITIAERAKTTVDLGESHFREFKSGLQGPPGDKVRRDAKEIGTDVARTLVAFANADGGELLVGVEDNGTVTGLDGFSDKELAQIEEAPIVRIHNDTPLVNVRRSIINIDGKKVFYFSVPKSTSCVHHTSDGRCLQRKDLESVPISAETIQFHRNEVVSQEYDREFIEGPQADTLDQSLIEAVASQISKGMSNEKCLQYLDLVEYGQGGLRLRRAALLLFAKEPQKWHPRTQIRIMKVEGNELNSGTEYNVSADEIVTNNILELLETGWDALRPYLVQTSFGADAKFGQRVTYPEHACREALVNAIAHRDYSQEGRGIEIYVYRDRMEVTNPGGLLSVIDVKDLVELRGVHQSRNGLIARVLRELGYMRELGEGMRRIFSLMKRNELAEPKISNERDSFTISLYHRPMYTNQEQVWLDQFSEFALDREQKAILLLGEGGKEISPQSIWNALGIVDTEHYRQLVHSLQQLNILENVINKIEAQRKARRKRVTVREIPRFRIRMPNEKTISGKIPDYIPNGTTGDDQKTLRLWVGNLDPETEKSDLVTGFDSFGVIEYVYIPTHGDKGRGKGYAFIEFESEQAGLRALESSSPIIVRGRTVRLRYANPLKSKPKG